MLLNFREILMIIFVFCLLGVHQVALLTHIDQLCSSTAKNVNHVYKSGIIQEAVGLIIYCTCID